MECAIQAHVLPTNRNALIILDCDNTCCSHLQLCLIWNIHHCSFNYLDPTQSHCKVHLVTACAVALDKSICLSTGYNKADQMFMLVCEWPCIMIELKATSDLRCELDNIHKSWALLILHTHVNQEWNKSPLLLGIFMSIFQQLCSSCTQN